ncbi:general amidase [Pholiota conissans]|uniref:amidase n=1 Tax=Pholiota conissans TaxID=109636 RepID=A0A9P5Z614_9AGAR|nr:general amidase [Pholiota conissans]
MSTQHWKEIVAQKRQQRTESIPKEWILTNLPSQDTLNVIDFPESCGLLTELDIQITNTEVTLLLEKLAQGTWSAVEVTTAFAKRAIIAQQLVNCLTEIFVDKALARAAELDAHLKTTGKVVGPLHGLPISLKDQINVKGVDSTMGYVSWAFKPATKNAVLADILEANGAVLYVKTNIPQTLMWGETFNHVFGRTTNPYNRNLTSGGSSGGEGALVALKGCPIGVGSDIGGSVRIPSAFNGVYGLRGSYGRIPYGGCVNSLEGQDSILSVLGPLSNSIGGLKVFVKSVVDQKPWFVDPLAVRKPWNEEEYQLIEHGKGEKLCFGILWDDGITKPHPPVIRGLEETKKALLAAGHQVVDWKPLNHGEFYKAAGSIWSAAAAEDFRVSSAPTGEPVIETMDLSYEDVDAPPTESIPLFRPNPNGISSYELWQVQRRKRDLRQEYLDHWNATAVVTDTGRPVDAIISPCAAYVAPPHGMNKSAVYTTIWNVLDYVALVVPTGKFVDPVLDAPRPPHEFYSSVDKENYEFYKPETFKDAPITIQVVGRTLEEEAVIGMAEIVDAALKAYSPKL